MERMISPEIMPSVRRLSLKFVKNYGVVSLCSQCPEYTHNVQNIQIIILHFQIKKNSSFFYYQIKICFLRFVSCLWRNVSLKTDSVTKSCFSVLSHAFTQQWPRILLTDTSSSDISSACLPNCLQQLAENQDIASDDKKQTQFCCK